MRCARGMMAMALLGGMTALAAPAAAMPESCQKEFNPLMEKRQAYMNQINGFQKRKPTAPVACNAFGGLASSNRKLVEWMESQKDWCQIPDDMLNGIKDQQGQIDKVRGTACDAAAKQAKMMGEARRRAAQSQRQQQGGPGIGGGVRLPQGAL